MCKLNFFLSRSGTAGDHRTTDMSARCSAAEVSLPKLTAQGRTTRQLLHRGD